MGLLVLVALVEGCAPSMPFPACATVEEVFDWSHQERRTTAFRVTGSPVCVGQWQRCYKELTMGGSMPWRDERMARLGWPSAPPTGPHRGWSAPHSMVDLYVYNDALFVMVDAIESPPECPLRTWPGGSYRRW